MSFLAIDETNGAATLQALCNGGPGNDTAILIDGPVTTVSVP
jgi:hypothetical protein